MIENSSTTQLCNITLEESDLKKLDQLDPNQTQGLQTFSRLSIPITITYTNQQSQQFTDKQTTQLQLLTRISQQSIPGNRKSSKKQHLEHLQLFLTSQTDLYFNFVSNITQNTYEKIINNNQLNIKFNQLPTILTTMLKNCYEQQNGYSSSNSSTNQCQLSLNYQGTGKLIIYQQTEYKKLKLIELFVNRSAIEKSHQSIIYRFNYQKAKLHMLDNSIESIYEILEKKNKPLLQLIKSKVGVSQ